MAADEDDVLKASEQTPLLSRTRSEEPPKWGKSVLYRILLCAFMVSLSFGVTQVPLIYVFRVMTCEAYYDKHQSPPPDFTGDRCSVPEIEASTAKAVSLLGAGTTLFGLVNLFVTGWTIKKIGIKGALIIQVFWPAARLAIQNIGVMKGGEAGIWIIQGSQIITILGGPNGYLLALNSFITEVTEHEQRTPALGRLQGAMFFGTSIGYSIGGEISERFGIIYPFRVTLGLFLFSTIYVILALPSVPIEKAALAVKTQGFKRFLGPLKIFAPSRWALPDGRVQTESGPILLAIGVYFGILATGYIPVLLQMYSTDVFGFGTRQNGWLIALNSMLRGLFLTFAFPRIIAFGRKKVSARLAVKGTTSFTDRPDGPTQVSEIDAVDPMDNEQEPFEPLKPPAKQETFDFDLIYARYSLLLDGILIGGASFISQGWQIYLVAIALPFAAGTGATSKGSILQMCSTSERTDALSAITLVENIARLTTTSIFGLIFAAFANIEKTYLVFTINASAALLGFLILLFARFPPKDATRLDEMNNGDE